MFPLINSVLQGLNIWGILRTHGWALLQPWRAPCASVPCCMAHESLYYKYWQRHLPTRVWIPHLIQNHEWTPWIAALQQGSTQWFSVGLRNSSACIGLIAFEYCQSLALSHSNFMKSKAHYWHRKMCIIQNNAMCIIFNLGDGRIHGIARTLASISRP